MIEIDLVRLVSCEELLLYATGTADLILNVLDAQVTAVPAPVPSTRCRRSFE